MPSGRSSRPTIPSPRAPPGPSVPWPWWPVDRWPSKQAGGTGPTPPAPSCRRACQPWTRASTSCAGHSKTDAGSWWTTSGTATCHCPRLPPRPRGHRGDGKTRLATRTSFTLGPALWALAACAPARARAPAPLPDTAEVRALWVVRSTLADPDSARAMVRRAAEAGFNTLILQVRGRGDAYYRSRWRSEEHTSELQSQSNLVCRLLLEKKKIYQITVFQAEHPAPQT